MKPRGCLTIATRLPAPSSGYRETLRLRSAALRAEHRRLTGGRTARSQERDPALPVAPRRSVGRPCSAHGGLQGALRGAPERRGRAPLLGRALPGRVQGERADAPREALVADRRRLPAGKDLVLAAGSCRNRNAIKADFEAAERFRETKAALRRCRELRSRAPCRSAPAQTGTA